MRRLLLTALLVVGIAAATSAFAAGMSSSSTNLGAGNASVTSCATGSDLTGMTVTYDTVTGGKVATATVGNIPTSCRNGTFRLWLTLTKGSTITKARGPVGITTGTVSFGFTGTDQPSTADVTESRVAIVGRQP